MNSDDPFEKRLCRQRWRELPPGWRQEILAAAAEASTKEALAPEQTSAARLWGLLCEWMWPHPRAWAGLASAWFFVIVLNWPATQGVTQSRAVATAASRMSPQAREMLRAQQKWLAELAGIDQPIAKSRATAPAGQSGGMRAYETNA